MFAAVAVAADMTERFDTDVCGDAAAAQLTLTRVLYGPSNEDSDVGDWVAQDSQRCAGCVGVAPPRVQSRTAFAMYGVRGIRRA